MNIEDNENLESALEELKRTDHLIFVSLKYTRTCDVLKHVIERMINCVDFLLTAILEDLIEKRQLEEVPKAPVVKANKVKEKFPDDELLREVVDFFLFLRKINREEFSRSCEFRRHVTLTVELDDISVEIDIDKTTEWYKKLKEYNRYICKLVCGDECCPA